MTSRVNRQAYEGDEGLRHLLPVLEEVKGAFGRAPAYSKDDVTRAADLIENLHGNGTILEKALAYAEETGPNMFARAVAVELERRRNSVG